MANRKAPAGLTTAGQALWRKTLAEFELSEHEYPILEAACRELGLIRRIEAVLGKAKLVVEGSMGQDTAHPLLAEVRQHRAAYVSLVKSLKLPEGDAGTVPNPRSASAQAAANARWSRGA